ncbi:hypothetical protein JTB14_034241 [Gonioctena quinquepunctata]|nr:hypothetical protein JTB14_034241 [Gonioctena quinquepunctata]
MKNNFEKTLAERDTKLQERASEIQQKNEEMLKNVDVLDKLRVEFEKKSLEFEEMKAALETAKKESDNIILTKNTEISQISDSLKGKDLLIQTLQTELQTTKVDLESVSNNLVQYQTNLSDVESNLKMERDEIKELLKTKIVELEEAKSDFSNVFRNTTKNFQALFQLMEKTKEYENSLKDLEIVKENNTSSNKSLTEAHEKQLLETEKKIAQLAEEVQRKDEEIRNNSQKMSELDGNYKGKQLEIENIQKEFEQMKQKYESESALIANLDEEKNALAKAKEELRPKSKT